MKPSLIWSGFFLSNSSTRDLEYRKKEIIGSCARNKSNHKLCAKNYASRQKNASQKTSLLWFMLELPYWFELSSARLEPCWTNPWFRDWFCSVWKLLIRLRVDWFGLDEAKPVKPKPNRCQFPNVTTILSLYRNHNFFCMQAFCSRKTSPVWRICW